MKKITNKTFVIISLIYYCSYNYSMAQTHFASDPYNLLSNEKLQFDGLLPMKANIFRPIFFNTDTVSFSLSLRNENYYNNNVSNQENMDVRYFSKGAGHFTSVNLAFNSPYLSFMVEPYIINNSFLSEIDIDREGVFSVLNDQNLTNSNLPDKVGFRNLLAFIHYKGFGIGWHKGNRWWGPGIHTSLQMTNNTQPFMAQILGTIQEIRIGSFGLYGLYTFAKLNDETDYKAKFFTSINGALTWYGPIVLSAGFNRTYISGGVKTHYGKRWTASDAKLLIFEGLLTSNLLKNEYSFLGHDSWDQTIAGYLTITLPKRNFKVYAEIGINDNRMFFADLLSQPDHTAATIIGFRDYGAGSSKNWIYGFEWSNLMLTYTIRHRGAGGVPAWYSSSLYDYSSYKGRRWGAHSGSDSDDWYAYMGYLSENLMIVPAVNYERHGIVSHRPAEVKLEYRMDIRFKYNDIWFGVFLENQFEAFLGFPDYFYEDKFGNPIDASQGTLANTRKTKTLIFTLSRSINF